MHGKQKTMATPVVDAQAPRKAAASSEQQLKAEQAHAKLLKARAALATLKNLHAQLTERQDAVLSQCTEQDAHEAAEQGQLLKALRDRADEATSRLDAKSAARILELDRKQQLQATVVDRLAAAEDANQIHANALCQLRARCAVMEREVENTTMELQAAATMEIELERLMAEQAKIDGQLKAQLDEAARKFDVVQQELRESNSRFSDRKQALADAVKKLEDAQAHHRTVKARSAQQDTELRPLREMVHSNEAKLAKARLQCEKVKLLREALR